MVWQNSNYLWLLLLVPLLVGMVWWIRQQVRKKRQRYFNESIFNSLKKNNWELGGKIKHISLYVALAFLVVALAGPKIGTQVRQVKRQGIDMMIALDLSASMNAEDVKPSRLDKAKYEIKRLIRRLKGDRVGLIVFTGDAFLQSPMTLDYSALRMFLNVADTDQMPSSSTDFAEAMRTAHKAFKSEDDNKTKASKVLMIISDGEDHGESFDNALKSLVKENVSVYTLGVGTREGTTIPIYDDQSGNLIGYKRDKSGKVVTTKLESQVLRKIADEGNGEYYEINGGGDGIDAFLGRIDEMEKGEFASQEYADYKNQYQWLAGIGLGLLLISFFTPSYKNE